MKKLRIIIASAAIVAAAMTGYNALQKSTSDDLLRRNIEALAGGEDDWPECQNCIHSMNHDCILYLSNGETAICEYSRT